MRHGEAAEEEAAEGLGCRVVRAFNVLTLMALLAGGGVPSPELDAGQMPALSAAEDEEQRRPSLGLPPLNLRWVSLRVLLVLRHNHLSGRIIPALRLARLQRGAG